MRRGEVRWHEPPDSKRRPVLILTRDELISGAFDVIAVPATGTIRGLPSEVLVGVPHSADHDARSGQATRGLPGP